MKRTLATLLFVTSLALPAVAQVADGDTHYGRRAEGAQGARANGTQIDAAIAAYQKGIAQNPNDLEARWKLLRALRFKGAYVATTDDAKKTIFDQARKSGQQSMVVLDRLLATKGVRAGARSAEKTIADAARSIPQAGSMFYWDAVNWGEWALVYGKMAAVKQGAADRIKREATIAMMIDPKLEGGGGARVLGRLHDQTPRVPFLTGWASSELAVKYLTQSLASDPSNKLTKVFLAEAMVGNDKKTKAQAEKMLREVISSPNDAAFIVEQTDAVAEAKQLLASWK